MKSKNFWGILVAILLSAASLIQQNVPMGSPPDSYEAAADRDAPPGGYVLFEHLIAAEVKCLAETAGPEVKYRRPVVFTILSTSKEPTEAEVRKKGDKYLTRYASGCDFVSFEHTLLGTRRSKDNAGEPPKLPEDITK